MLPIASLVDKVPFSAITVSMGSIALAALIVLLVQFRNETTDNDSAKSKLRKIHRPDTTLPRLENTLAMIRAACDGNLHDRAVEICSQFNGEPILFRSIGMPDKLVVSTPEVFDDVLKQQFSNFPKGSYMRQNLKDLLGDGVFAADEDLWKTATTIQRHTVVLFDILGRKLFNRFALEVVAEIGFGVRMGSLDSDEEHPIQKAFNHAQRALLLRFVRPGWFWKIQRWLGVGVEGEFKHDLKVINTTVMDIVEKALARRSSNNSDNANDILSLILDNVGSSPNADKQQFDPVFLRDIAVMFLVAGRDTVAQTLSWLYLMLSKNTYWEVAIRSEMLQKTVILKPDATDITIEDVDQLVALEAVLMESLRLHPPVPMIPKYVEKDTTLADGTFVEANSLIVLATYAMARMEQVWGPDAAEFKPLRWIDSSSGWAEIAPSKFRLYLGMDLVMSEMKLVMAGLLTKFHIEVQDLEKVAHDVSLTLPVKGSLDAKIIRCTYSKLPKHS
ncbi:hypothetical protein PPTG_21036 [Phytophthora nicotianae INRA-310]|uniref:Cytochrome P450 n=1 Tax=Phytophthora nicotianae (strain INRA-310) TaxID=761204 RepID=W2R8D5_PHYN3|nr:hypothetical protein PPTG_21036 [Phytophthora nicotianae INRA-310]ETN20964.1 hypothetical protein PPTG_21036 [Phytophthora nicotianae INRA-310]